MFFPTALALLTTVAVASTSQSADVAPGLLKRSAASHSGSEARFVRRSAHQRFARQAEAALSPLPSPANASLANASPANASHLAMPTATKYNGTALWFNQTAGKMGACLKVNVDSDFVVGLSTQFWNDTTVPSPLCGESVLIRNPENGANITAIVADASGKMEYTTLTIGAFQALGVSLETGMFSIEYSFLNSTNLTSNAQPASLLSAVTLAGVPTTPQAVEEEATSTAPSAPTTTAAPAAPSVDAAAAASRAAAASSSSSAAAAQASRDAQGARDAQAARDKAASDAAAGAARAAQAARDRDAAAAAAKAAADAKWAADEAAKNKPAPGGGGDTHSGGHATFYYQNGVTGACGTVGQDSDFIAAMDSRLYQRTPNGRSALCDRQVRITRPDNGKSVTVRVRDECPTCQSANSVDLSVAAFRMIAAEAEGLVPITWSFV